RWRRQSVPPSASSARISRPALKARRPYSLLTGRISSGTELERDDDPTDLCAREGAPHRDSVAMVAAEVRPQLHGGVVHAAGGRTFYFFSGLSSGPRRLDELHRPAYRPGGSVRRPRELRVAVGRRHLLALGVQHAALYDR